MNISAPVKAVNAKAAHVHFRMSDAIRLNGRSVEAMSQQPEIDDRNRAENQSQTKDVSRFDQRKQIAANREF